MMYALPLENPPLLVVSDRRGWRCTPTSPARPASATAWTLTQLRPELQQQLRRLWTEPDSFRPRRTTREITEAAARTFAGTAERLRAAGVAPQQVSHFLTQCVFCFFAEDVGAAARAPVRAPAGAPVPPRRCGAAAAPVRDHARAAACSASTPCPGSTAACLPR
jgi:hypothetical protein